MFRGKGADFRKIRFKRSTLFLATGWSGGLPPLSETVHAIEQLQQSLYQFSQACRIDDYFGFLLPSCEYLKSYFDLYPEERNWMRQLVTQERCQTPGVLFEPLASVTGGEACVRQLVLAGQIAETMLANRPLFLAGNCGSFCASQWPQLLRKAGIYGWLMIAGQEKGRPQGSITGECLHWLAPNGQAVWVVPALQASGNLDALEKTVLDEQEGGAFAKTPHARLFIRLGNLPAVPIELLGHCGEKTESDPSWVISGAGPYAYFAYLQSQEKAGRLRVPNQFVVGRDAPPHRKASRGELLRAQRQLENRLFEAECWQSFVAILALPFDARPIHYAWRLLLQSQERATLAGERSEIETVDTLDRMRQGLELAESSCERAIDAIASQVATASEPGDQTGLLFHCLPWDAQNIVECLLPVDVDEPNCQLFDRHGEEIVYEIEPIAGADSPQGKLAMLRWVQHGLPPCGYAEIRRYDSAPNLSPRLTQEQNQTWLDNDLVRVEVDAERGGGIKSLMHLETGRELIAPHDQVPACTVAWYGAPLKSEPIGLLDLGNGGVKHFECAEGPVSKRLILWADGPGRCSRVQELRLYHDLPYVDFTLVLVNVLGEKEGRPDDFDDIRYFDIEMLIPLQLPGSVAVLDEPFYARAHSPMPGSWFLPDAHQSAPIAHQSALNRWVDVSWSFVLRFLDGSEEAASLALSEVEVWVHQQDHRQAAENLCAFFVRHGVGARIVMIADDAPKAQAPVVVLLGHPESFAAMGAQLDGVEAAAQYVNSSLQQVGSALALVPFQGAALIPNTTALLFAGKTPHELDQLIHEMATNTIAHRWNCSASSLFVEGLDVVADAGLSIMSQQPTLCGLDPNGILGMQLLGSVEHAYAQTDWNHHFFEQKTHTFRFRLFPHEGDWRHAEIPRRAMEFHHPPRVQWVEPHDGALPRSQSFLSVEPSNILVSSIKPPWSGGEGNLSRKAAMALRLYEAHGEESNVWIDSKTQVRQARLVDLHEKPAAGKRDLYREEQFIRGVVHANDIVTLALDLKPAWKADPHRLPDAPSAIGNLSSQPWMTHQGFLPESVCPVTIAFRPLTPLRDWDAQGRIQPVELVVVNHHPADRYEGTAALETAAGLRVLPQRVRYHVEPGDYQVIPIYLMSDGARWLGYLRGQTDVAGQTIETLLPLGGCPDFEIRMTLNLDGFHIHLRHAYGFTLRGLVRLVTPMETWPHALGGADSLSAIPWAIQPFEAASQDEVTVTFPIYEWQNRFHTSTDHHWVIIKLICHHTIRYYHIRFDGGVSEGLGQVVMPRLMQEAK